jgi:hypothetical protein
MAPTFASALTLSAVALGSRAFTRLGTKRFDVQGLPILLDALKEPASRKGKERERIVLGENGEEIRRGIVTGERRRRLGTAPLLKGSACFVLGQRARTEDSSVDATT